MNSSEYANLILSHTSSGGDNFVAPPLKEKQKRNAGNVMQQIVSNRMESEGCRLERQKGARFRWGEGIVLIRNSRVGNGFWSNMFSSQLTEIRELASGSMMAFVFSHFDADHSRLHVWAIPNEIALPAFDSIPDNQSNCKTIFIDPTVQRFKYAENSADLGEYYRSVPLTNSETDALVAGVKQDLAAKELASTEDADDEVTDAEEEDGATEIYTQETVDFLLELPEHTSDGDWHKANKDRYERSLRNPTVELIDQLRTQYVAPLDSDVAGTKRNHSILKKNDYGHGGYHSHYWAAFYDPEAGSKIKSSQLFFRMLGEQKLFRYGFAFGNNCQKYIANLHQAISESPEAVAEYLSSAPAGTLVRINPTDDAQGIETDAFCKLITKTEQRGEETLLSSDSAIDIARSFPLDDLPERAHTLSSEIGSFFEWVWPFFEASRTGQWVGPSPDAPASVDDETDDAEQLDEDAPQSLGELSELSALPIGKLQEIEDGLLTKQQIVLTGPPGTSKTYIAQLFSRYFVAQRVGHAQGARSTLYMHANWAYEDFFEGIKPFTRDGNLQFEPKLGYLLEWIESLRTFDATARHVLVLDEINRCDTAAVLGELLQLLEYRGRDVRLLSGRIFRFPKNVYIIGTMNSADRSIGRMDLALRRRFLWLDLVPDYQVLNTWLGRTGNNPAHFSSEALRQCNQLLEDRGIPPEQQVGHALFMVQTFGSDTQEPKDKPLIPDALRRIVRFSVVPYVRELCLMQLGRGDNDLVSRVEQVLLACLNDDAAASGDLNDSPGDS